MVTLYFTLLFDDILRMRFFSNTLIIANISPEFKFEMNLHHMSVFSQVQLYLEVHIHYSCQRLQS